MKALDTDWIRVSIKLKMLDPDPESINTGSETLDTSKKMNISLIVRPTFILTNPWLEQLVSRLEQGGGCTPLHLLPLLHFSIISLVHRQPLHPAVRKDDQVILLPFQIEYFPAQTDPSGLDHAGFCTVDKSDLVAKCQNGGGVGVVKSGAGASYGGSYGGAL